MTLESTSINKPATTIVASGSYIGNGTANRAITHALGLFPKLVIITTQGYEQFMVARFSLGVGSIITYLINSNWYPLTDVSASVFYVGNATNYPESANESGVLYHWVAFR